MKKTTKPRSSSVRNDYRCSIEKNQTGKYCVRIRVLYPRHAWTLAVFFLASSFDRAMKKLEESLHFLQRNEEKLWFWAWTAPKTWPSPLSSLRRRVSTWTAATSSPAKPPTSPSSPNAMSRPSSLGQFAAVLPKPSNSPASSPPATDLASHRPARCLTSPGYSNVLTSLTFHYIMR